jgi:hypothetical protein
MPATLGEAFVSPMKDRSTKTNSTDSSSTEDIRNPGYGWQVMPQAQPEPQFYRDRVGHQAVYQSRLNPGEHQCDRLILELMMCPHCREKLNRINSVGTGAQTGGGIPNPWASWNTFTTNIALGLLFLFCLDRILKYRLVP